MITFDAFEQVHAEPLELVGADAGGDGRPGFVQVMLNFGLGQRPHGHPRDGYGFEQNFAVTRDRNGRMQFVRITGEGG